MTTLTYETYVAPAKPVVSADLAPGETQESWSPTSSTLIHGARDAVLVDALLTEREGRALAEWVAASGRNLTTIYITHGHGDHFFGALPILERFPSARLVATPGVVEFMSDQLTPTWLDGFWRKSFPEQIVERPPIAEAIEGVVELEGEELVPVELGHSDTDHTTALHAPSIGLVAAGDSVYNDVHLYLAEGGHGGLGEWAHALDVVDDLHPQAVVAGHKRPGAVDDPACIDDTREYLAEFADAVRVADHPRTIYDIMIERYPDRINRAVVWHSAEAAMT